MKAFVAEVEDLLDGDIDLRAFAPVFNPDGGILTADRNKTILTQSMKTHIPTRKITLACGSPKMAEFVMNFSQMAASPKPAAIVKVPTRALTGSKATTSNTWTTPASLRR
jgi:hypothetical protein